MNGWNTEAMRRLMLDAVRLQYNQKGGGCGDNWTQLLEQTDMILLLGMPELEVLSWEESQALFGQMYPDSGIYMETHRHLHEYCGHAEECPWVDRGQPCQATEHWDKRCDNCAKTWWDKYGKAEADKWIAENPPRWIHDHGPDPINATKCTEVGCRNYGKVYNGYETWNGGM